MKLVSLPRVVVLTFLLAGVMPRRDPSSSVASKVSKAGECLLATVLK